MRLLINRYAKTLGIGALLFITLFSGMAHGQSVTGQEEDAEETTLLTSTWIHSFIAAGWANEMGGELEKDPTFSLGLGSELHLNFGVPGLVIGLEYLDKGSEHNRFSYLDVYFGMKFGKMGFHGGAAIEGVFALYPKVGMFTPRGWDHDGGELDGFRRVNVGPRVFLGYAIPLTKKIALNAGMHFIYHLAPDDHPYEEHFMNIMFHIGIIAIPYDISNNSGS